MSRAREDVRRRPELLEEIERLRTRLGETEQALQAIRSGEVDAVVVSGPQGEQLFSLSGAERVYRVIVESMHEAALTVGGDGTILFCNQRFCDLVRTPMPETIGRPLLGFTGLPQQAPLGALLDDARTRPVQRRLVLRAADGASVPVLLAASPLETEGGPSVCLVASDLTDLEASAASIHVLHEHEQALEASEARYRALVEVAPDGIVVYQDGCVVYANPRALGLYGAATPEDLLGHDVLARIHPDERAAIEERIRMAMRGQTTPLRESRLLRLDGREVSIEAAATLTDWRGRPAIQVVMRDVTERKQVERALRESEARFRVLAEAMPQIVWSADAEGRFDYYNPRAYEYGGVGSEEVASRGWQKVIHPDDLARTGAAWSRALQIGESYEIEQRLRRADGEYRWHLTRGLPMRDEQGRIVRWIGTATDIHEQKRAEQELKKLNRTLRALGESNQALLRAGDEAQFLEVACRIVVEDCGHALVWIGYAEDDDVKSVRPVASAGFEEGYLETLKITWGDGERGRGPTGTAIRTGQTSMCRNMLTDPAMEPWLQEALKRGYAASLALPLLAGGRAFGAITIYSREPDPFTPDEVALLSELANDLAYGIGSLRLRAAHQQAEEALARSEAGYRTLFDSLTEGFAVHEIVTDEGGEPRDYRFLEVNPAFEQLTGLRREDVIGRLHNELLPDDDPRWVQTCGAVALTGKPARFDLYSPALRRHYEVYAYRSAPRQFATLFVDITGRVETERLSRAINSIDEVVHSTLDADEILRRALASAADALGCDSAAVSLRDVDRWVVRHVVGLPPEAVGMEMNDDEERHAMLAIQTRAPVAVSDALGDSRVNREHLAKWGIRSVLVVPILTRLEVLGVLFLNYQRAPFAFEDRHVDFARKLSASLGLALDNSRLYADVRYELGERKQAEQALRAALAEAEGGRRTLQALMDHVPVGITIADARGNLRMVSRRGQELLGESHAGLGMSEVVERWKVFAPDGVTPQAVDEVPLTRALRGEIVLNQELVQLDAAGKRLSLLCNAAPIRDAGGRIVAGVVTWSDISERKQAEDALRQLKDELETRVAEQTAELRLTSAYNRRLIEASLDPMVTISAEGRITDLNSATEEITGRTRAELVGTDFSSCFTDPDEARASYEQVFREGSVRDYPLEIRGRDGRVTPVLYHATVLRDDSGKVAGVFAAARDITALRRAEQALKEANEALERRVAERTAQLAQSEELLRAVTENTEDAVYVKDRQSRWLMANPALLRIVGKPAEQVLGKSDGEIYEDPAIGEAIVANDRKVLESEQPAAMEETAQTPRGLRVFLSTKAPRRDGEGRVIGLVGISRDITERKEAEAALRRSHERFRLLSDVSGRLLAAEHPQAIVDELCAHVMAHLDCQVFFNFVVDPARGRLHLNACAGIPADEARQIEWLDYGIAVCGCVAQAGVRIVAEDIQHTSDPRTDMVRAFGVQAYACHPLLAGAEVIGTLSFGATNRPRFAPDELALMKTVADQVAIAMERIRAKEALRESEAQFRAIFEVASVGIVQADPRDGRILRCNDKYREITGLGEAELLGRSFTELTHPEDRERDWQIFSRAARDETPDYRNEKRYRRRDGSTVWVRINASFIRDAAGEAVRTVAVVEDVTERKRDEEAIEEGRRSLQREKEILQAVMNGARNSHLVYLDRDFDFVRVNETYARSCGYAPDEMVGKNHFALYPHEENEAIFTRVRDTGVPAEYHDRPFVFPDQPERGITYWDWTLNPMAGPDGRVQGLVFSLVETTERVRAEAALRESEERYRSLVELSPEAVLVHQDGRVVYANPAAQRLFAAEGPERLLGCPLLDLVHPDDRGTVTARVQSILGGQRAPAREIRLLRLDGQPLISETTGAPVEFRGRPAVQVIARDATERRRLEERIAKAQKLEAIGLLAGGVAHDFNNLLVGVIGNASLAQEMLPPGSSALPLMERIVRTGEQAAHLTRQLLAYAGKGQIVMEPVDLSQLVRESAELLRSSIPNKILLRMDLAEDLPAVRADRGQAHQVFMNLALNASEAIGSGPGLISVRTSVLTLDEGALAGTTGAEVGPGEYVCLEVTDNGGGMDDETLARIFDPFFTTKFLGRGLGLAAVSGIVRSHGGAIRVESEPGRGSRFTVLLPALRGEAPAAAGAPRPGERRGTGTILLVDDEEIVLETAKVALERRGYDVLVASSGPQAVKVYRRESARVDLVILDLSMPGMGGEEVLPELLRIRSDARVVVSSGYSQDEAMKHFHGLRATGFIQKPYTAGGLAAEVGRVLE